MIRSHPLRRNHRTIKEHVENINRCRHAIKDAVFDFVDAIKAAFDELGEDVFQSELATSLGMTPSTLNRWKSIAESPIIADNRDKVPPTFSSLYEITLLEKSYEKYHGETIGKKEVQKLINRRSINPETQTSDIRHKVTEIKRLTLSEKRQEKEQFLLKKDNAKGYLVDQKYQNLSSLISKGVKFRTIVVVPPSDLLTKWADEGVLNKDIAEEFPISEIRGKSEEASINIFIYLPSHRVDVGIKILRASGFSFREILLPPNPSSGFVSKSNENVIIFGQRGRGKKLKSNPSPHAEIGATIVFAEELSEGPHLMLFHTFKRGGWLCLPTPI